LASGQGTPPLGRVRHARLADYVTLARSLLFTVQVAADVPRIRDDLIDTLVEAIHESDKLAKEESPTVERGSGGVSPKARWYQLLGYLAQVLDGVCKNVELSEINERLLRVEKELKVAPGGPSQACG
jgi:hypothetical protein